MVIVVCGIIERDGLVLSAQRSNTMSQSNLWEFPGGKLEPGETEVKGLKREIKEELDLEIIPLNRLSPVKHSYKDTIIELIPYRCTVKSGTLKLREHQRYEWLPMNKLGDLNWCPADIPILHEYLQLYEKL